mmetsp:Transcript_6652/g.16090  ORF Transcript_6652/g.16090 Transcript_6652/m.16090 type:complete len:399 (-) Transcript_6652:31-1227(-)
MSDGGGGGGGGGGGDDNDDGSDASSAHSALLAVSRTDAAPTRDRSDRYVIGTRIARHDTRRRLVCLPRQRLPSLAFVRSAAARGNARAHLVLSWHLQLRGRQSEAEHAMYAAALGGSAFAVNVLGGEKPQKKVPAALAYQCALRALPDAAFRLAYVLKSGDGRNWDATHTVAVRTCAAAVVEGQCLVYGQQLWRIGLWEMQRASCEAGGDVVYSASSMPDICTKLPICDGLVRALAAWYVGMRIDDDCVRLINMVLDTVCAANVPHLTQARSAVARDDRAQARDVIVSHYVDEQRFDDAVSTLRCTIANEALRVLRAGADAVVAFDPPIEDALAHNLATAPRSARAPQPPPSLASVLAELRLDVTQHVQQRCAPALPVAKTWNRAFDDISLLLTLVLV